jgi:hypothetical protein
MDGRGFTSLNDHINMIETCLQTSFGLRIELTVMDKPPTCQGLFDQYQHAGQMYISNLISSGLVIEVDSKDLFGLFLLFLKAVKTCIQATTTLLSNSANNYYISRSIAEAFAADCQYFLLMIWTDTVSSTKTLSFISQHKSSNSFKKHIDYDMSSRTYGVLGGNISKIPWLQCILAGNLSHLKTVVSEGNFKPFSQITERLFKSVTVRRPRTTVASRLAEMDSSTKVAIESVWHDEPIMYQPIKADLVQEGLRKLLKISYSSIFCNMPKTYHDRATGHTSFPISQHPLTVPTFQGFFLNPSPANASDKFLVTVKVVDSCWFGRATILFGMKEEEIQHAIMELSTKSTGQVTKKPQQILEILGTQLDYLKRLAQDSVKYKQYFMGRKEMAYKFLPVLPPFLLTTRLWPPNADKNVLRVAAFTGVPADYCRMNCPLQKNGWGIKCFSGRCG